MSDRPLHPGITNMLEFSLVEALMGRRSRRFFKGAHIPDGVLAHKSSSPPQPLSKEEKLYLLTACAGNTSWHHMIYRGQNYAPHLSNYAGAAGGRTFPSGAGFHTSMTFFCDDEGVFVLDNRDAPAFTDRDPDGGLSLDQAMRAVEAGIKKLRSGRINIPPQKPYVEAHNTWVVNRPGTFLVIPVADLSQHMLLNYLYMRQNGLVLYDDINGRPIPGIEEYKDIVDVDQVWPLTFVEQWCMAECSTELSCSCYAGCLMLQAMGLGGWMFNGMNPFALLGASGDPKVPGLGFRYDESPHWPYPNPTGLPGVMEGCCPPHVADMREAVEKVCQRKFGPGGPFNPETPGPWRDSAKVRGAARVHGERFKDCVALQAQYVLDTFGKFPGTVPTIFLIMILQAHHLDLEFYDKFYEPGAYLKTHAEHDRNWHP